MRRRSVFITAIAALLTFASAATAADCEWARQRDGSTWGACVDNTGKAYCLTCLNGPSGRVCSRTPCPG